MKLCNRCLEEKPLDSFSPLSNGKLGRRPSCKLCQSKQAKMYREQNPEASRKASKRYAQAHPEVISSKNKQFYLENKEKSLQAVREWRNSHLEETREHSRRHSNRRRARRLNNGIEPYTEQQVLQEYGVCCHLCNTEVDLNAPRKVGTKGWEQGLHIEHLVPIVLGGTDSLENVRPAHGLCNIKKGITITE